MRKKHIIDTYQIMVHLKINIFLHTDEPKGFEILYYYKNESFEILNKLFLLYSDYDFTHSSTNDYYKEKSLASSMKLIA